MNSELNSLTLDDFTALGEILWLKGYSSVNQAMRNSGMVKEINIPKNSGDTRKVSEMDDNEYLDYKAQDDQASRGQIQQGYSKTITKYRVAENLGISYEMRNEGKYEQVVSRLTNGGKKGANTLDLDLSMRISFMTAGSYASKDGRTITTTTGDGQVLAYSEHTLKGSSITYRNILANNPRISKGAIEAMERLIVEETYNNLGEAMTIPFDIMWTTNDPNSVNTAREYLKSTSDPEASHAGVTNVYAGKYKLAVLPRVAMTSAGVYDSDKRYYWGLASSQMSSFYLGIWEAPHLIPPAANDNSEDVETDSRDYRNRAGYGLEIVGAGFFKASKGDGSA